MSEKIRVNLLSFISLMVIYGVAFGFDRLTEYTQRLSGIYFDPIPGLLTWSASNIILVLLVFLFYRWAMPKLYRWIIWVIVILGFLIDFLPVLFLLPYSPLMTLTLFSHPLPAVLGVPYLLGGARGDFILVGALTAIAGVFTLFRSKKN